MHPKSLIFCILILLALNKNLSSQPHDAEIINYTTRCAVDKDKLTQTDTITIQINNRSGDKYTNINIPYSKTEKVSNIEAWIEEINGNKVRILKKSDITDRSAISDISLYEDNFVKCFQLKHNLYPYCITYTYQTTYKNYLIISRWSPVIDNSIPTKTAKLTVIVPKGFNFSKYSNNISDFRIDSTESFIELEYKASYKNPINTEIFSQPEDLKPFVLISPFLFNYGVDGCTKNWATYGNWQYRLLENLDILPENEKKTISSMVAGITDKIEIVKILYHYLQDNTRYINVSIGTGGLKPYPASYVVQNKYGDCKALTNYMKAMLSYVGIESFYTKVMASEQPQKLIESIAGPQFNHVVLAVPLNNDTIWLENTQNTSPFGYLGTYTQNRKALLVSKDNSKLVHIPALKAKENSVSYRLEFVLNTNENSTVSLQALYKGSYFEIFNQLHDDYTNDVKDRIFRDYLSFNNYEVKTSKLKRQNRDTANIVLVAELYHNKLLKPLGNDFYVGVFPNNIPAFTVPENRKLSVEIPFPTLNIDTLIYSIPRGYNLKKTADPITINTQYGKYEWKMNVLNSKVYIIKRFELYAGSYSTEQYPNFYSFIKSVKDKDQMNLVFTPRI